MANKTTAGIQNLRGKIGIGTNNPLDTLHVNGTFRIGSGSAEDDIFNIHQDSTSGIITTYRNNQGFVLNRIYADYDNDGTIVEYQERIGLNGNYSEIGNYSNHPLYIHTNNATRMTISSGGNVGIGTTGPRAKLEVFGENFAVTNSGRSVGGIHIASDSNDGAGTYSGGISFAGPGSGSAGISGVQGTSDGDTQGLAFFTHESGTGANDSIEKMRITYAGFVGIGKTDPSAPLHINGKTVNQVIKIQSNSAPYIRFKEGGTDVGFIQFGTDTYISNQKDGTLNFRTNNTDKMTILSNGRVGIGTTNPAGLFHVYGGRSYFAPSGDTDSGTGSHVIDIYNPHDTAFTANALTAYNAHTSWDIGSKSTYTISSRANDGSIYTFAGENASSAVAVNRYVQFNSDNDSPLLNWTFYQYDGSGTAASDLKVPSKVWTVQSYQSGGSDTLLILSGDGSLQLSQYGAGVLTTDTSGNITASTSVATSSTLDDVTDNGNSTENSIVTGGLGASGEIALYATGTADATNTEYDSNVLRFSTSGWDTNNSVARGVHWNIRSEASSNIYPDAYLTFYEENISYNHWKLKLPGRGSGSSYIHPDAALFNGNVVIYESDTSNANIKLIPDGDSYFANSVGIGTTNPVRELHIHSASNTQMQFTDDSTGSNDTDGLRIGWNGSVGQMYLFEDADIRFATNDSEKMRIKSGGNVGIGTAGPRVNLHIYNDEAGTISLSTTGSNAPTGAFIELENPSGGTGSGVGITATGLGTSGRYGAIAFVDDTSDNNGTGGHIEFYTSGSKTDSIHERMRIAKNGNVGIGTTGPDKKLEIKLSDVDSGTYYAQTIGGSSHLTGYAVGLGFDPEGYGNRNKVGIIVEGTGNGWSTGHMHFVSKSDTGSGSNDEATIANARMTITSGGNVGVGTTDPDRRLHVNSGSTNHVAIFESTDATAWIQIKDDATASYISTTENGLDIAADSNNEGASSKIRFYIDGSNKASINSGGTVISTNGFSSDDGVGKFYTWRAVNNTGNSANVYVKIARITASQSNRFAIELAGRRTSYSNNALPAYGKIVGQLNNDNNYDIVFYDFENTDVSVVEDVGQVDVSATETDIYIKVDNFSEISATAHISAGSIQVASTASATEPTGYVSANARYYMLNTSSGDDRYVNVTGDTMSGKLTIDRSTTNDPALTLNSASSGWGSGMRFKNTTTTTGKEFGIYSSGTGYFQFTKESDSYGTIMRFTPNDELELKGDNLLYTGSGNVGIGETNPGFKLDVKDPTSGIATIQVRNDEGTDGSGAGIRLYTSTDTYGNKPVYIKNIPDATGGALVINSRAADNSYSDTFYISGYGKVGIGNTSPTAKLDVDINSSNSYDSNTLTTPIVAVANRNASNVNNQAAGLHLYATGWAGSTTGVIALNAIQIGGNSSTADFAIQTRNAGTYAEKFRLTAAGNVGIGTTNPSSILHIGGGTVPSTVLDGVLLSLSGGGQYYQAYEDGKQIFMGVDASDYGIVGMFTNHPLGFRTNNTERLRIKTDGTIQFNDYGAGFLQTDANGNITAGSVTTSDTLDDVTDNGNSTTNSISVGGVTSTSDNTFKGDTYLENGGDDGAGTRVGNIWYSVSTGGGSAPVGVYESAVITTVRNGTHGRSDIVFKTKNNDTANFGSTNERMRITRNGLVGINETAPQAYLHIDGSSYPQLLLDGGSNTTGDIVVPDGEILQIGHWNNGTTTFTGRLWLSSGGHLGIGNNNPESLLHLGESVNGANIISFGDASLGGPHGIDFYGDDATRTLKYSIYYRTGTENISMETSNGTKRFEINQSGAVTFNEAFTFPTADGSADQALVTNGSGALSWASGYRQYSPVGWYLTTNTTYTTNADNIDSDSTQSAAGNTPVQRNSATEFQATKAGWYEITYNVVVENNYANRACIGAYVSYAHGQGGGVVQGSHSTEYVRYSTYGEFAQFTNTSYFYAPDTITKFYLRTLLKSGSMNMTTQAQNHNTITFRYINDIIS